MDLALTLRRIDDEGFVSVFVGGEDLGELIDAIIGRAAPGQNWGDDSLAWWIVDRRPSLTVFDEDTLAIGAEGAILFTCCCGEWAFSCVSARLSVPTGRIILDRFQGHRVCLLDQT